MKRLTKTYKQELVAGMTDALKENTISILANFSGLSVKEMESLRRSLREKKGRVAVAKNTLIGKAFENVGRTELSDRLKGPIFLVSGTGDDETGLIKTLLDFRKKSGKIELRGAIMGGDVLDSAQVERMGSLPGRRELQAMVIGTLRSPARRLVYSLRYPGSRLVNALKQIGQQKATKES